MSLGLILTLLNNLIKIKGKVFFSTIFFFAVAWTESKGPLIACIMSLIIYGYQRNLVRTVIFVPMLAIAAAYLSAELGLFQRAEALLRLASGGLSDADTGSILVRQGMIRRTMDLIALYPVLGVGLGNWSHFITIPTPSGVAMYPHNLFLELMAEAGILRGSIIIAALALMGFGSSRRFLPVIVLVCIAAMFSGDLSYGRFVLVAILLANIDAAVSRRV